MREVPVVHVMSVTSWYQYYQRLWIYTVFELLNPNGASSKTAAISNYDGQQ